MHTQNPQAVDATVSVVIPTFNRIHVLPRAVESVLKQTYPVHEIIVIDDGSEDTTEAWLKQQTRPIRTIKQQNHGVSHARNRGIEIATGNWIALLDSDDYWHNDKLEKQLRALHLQSDLRFCHCDEIWIRNGTRVNPKNKHRKGAGDLFEQSLALCAISPSAALIHRELFETYGLFDEALPACEDYDLWLRITASEQIAFVDEMLLTKTGGHDDQLSRRFAVMDRYRLSALAKLLCANTLNAQQRQRALEMFFYKRDIVKAGAVKRNNQPLLQELEKLDSDIRKAD